MNKTITKYSDFVHNHEQRPIIQSHVKKLIESMKVFGFLPSKPIQCYRKGGKLVVVDGHHRLAAAMQLNIDVEVVIENRESQETMGAVNSIVKKWEGKDFIRMYASRGNPHYVKLIDYKEKGIPYGMAGSMLIRNAASSGNANASIQNGTFTIKTTEIIDQVVDVVTEFEHVSPAIKSRPFIAAISKCIMCKEFSLDTFKSRLRENAAMMKKTSNEDQMLSLIESIYNHRSRNPLPLKFFVDTASKERNASNIGANRAKR
jgi:hypothetical protein